MKTDVNAFKACELIERLTALAPSVSFSVIWSHDEDHDDIRDDCHGFEDADPDEWQAWQSEVRALCVSRGKTLTGSAYLGGTWEKACDHPSESNPEISGYLPQMIIEATEELKNQLPESSPIHSEISAILNSI